MFDVIAMVAAICIAVIGSIGFVLFMVPLIGFTIIVVQELLRKK